MAPLTTLAAEPAGAEETCFGREVAWLLADRKLCVVTSVDVAEPRRTLTRVFGALIVAALVAFGPQCAEASAPAPQAAVSIATAGFTTAEAVNPLGEQHAGLHHSDGDSGTKGLLTACLSLLLIVLLSVAVPLVRPLLLTPASMIPSVGPFRQSRTAWLAVPTPVALGIARI